MWHNTITQAVRGLQIHFNSSSLDLQKSVHALNDTEYCVEIAILVQAEEESCFTYYVCVA